MKYAAVNRIRIVGFGAAVSAVAAMAVGCSATQDDSSPTSSATSSASPSAAMSVSASTTAGTVRTEVPPETGGDATTDRPATEDQPPATDVDYCASASLAGLRDAVAASPLAPRLYQPITLDRFSCSGKYAVAHNVTDGTVTPVSILYVYAQGAWTPIDMGSAMDCGSQGVPGADRHELPGCY
ncbi:hypothetical protein [Jongsikchunia kroppenstedtii]|uniref:hypothetical protein n=1 Tax=Jongsikchunia kroppenstedtii TaxID=1121721 RepID=UPI00036EEFF3|nr:hypothetical protein [Jongsikchunia kroppenstedtii]